MLWIQRYSIEHRASLIGSDILNLNNYPHPILPIIFYKNNYYIPTLYYYYRLYNILRFTPDLFVAL